MGIYKACSYDCKCEGMFSTLDPNDLSVYMVKPCEKHILLEGNTLVYELCHILNHITKKDQKLINIKNKYNVKILQLKPIYINENRKYLMKIEVIHNGEIDINKLDNNKNMLYSQMDDEPMWKQIDEHVIQMIFVFNCKHHTVEHWIL